MFPRRTRPDANVRRAALTAIIVVCLGLITVGYRGGVVVHPVQMAVLDVVAPIERGMSRAWDPVAGAWDWTGRLFHAMGDNPRLERENRELRGQLRIAKDQETTLADLNRQLGYQQRGQYPDAYEPVNGHVISRVPGATYRSIIIDLGTDDGIAKNDPVTTADGLIGRVIQVSATTARVGLILDSSAPVTARVSGSDGAEGTLRAVSSEGEAVMGLKVPIKAEVHERDMVMTAGFVTGDLRSLLPDGIPIGEVTSVGNSAGDVERTVQVTPYADFDSLDEIAVLVPRDGRRVVEAPPLATDAMQPSEGRRADAAVQPKPKKRAGAKPENGTATEATAGAG